MSEKDPIEECRELIQSKKKKRYSAKQFLDDYHSKEPNNTKATVKAVIAGSRVFFKESPHPFVNFIKETGREIFS